MNTVAEGQQIQLHCSIRTNPGSGWNHFLFALNLFWEIHYYGPNPCMLGVCGSAGHLAEARVFLGVFQPWKVARILFGAMCELDLVTWKAGTAS